MNLNFKSPKLIHMQIDSFPITWFFNFLHHLIFFPKLILSLFQHLPHLVRHRFSSFFFVPSLFFITWFFNLLHFSSCFTVLHRSFHILWILKTLHFSSSSRHTISHGRHARCLCELLSPLIKFHQKEGEVKVRIKLLKGLCLLLGYWFSFWRLH